MALVTCPDCKREMSSGAEKCPHCGRPGPATNAGAAFGLIVMLLAFGYLLWFCGTEPWKHH